MSRIGKLPIAVPEKVNLSIADRTVKVKGPLGELAHTFRLERVSLDRDGPTLRVGRREETRHARMEQGMVRALIANMVGGVVQGFVKELDIVGVGFNAEVKGKALNLRLGYSHPVAFEPPAGIRIECPAPTKIKISGPDKQLVGQVAAKIRGFRPPEPYKGKGIMYAGEKILRKAGKSGGKGK